MLIYLADNGKVVKEGEIVARIDAQSVIDHLEDVESSVTQAALDIRRRKAEYSAQTEYLQQRVRAAKGELEKAIQDARVTSLKPEITQELLRLAVSEAEAALSGTAHRITTYGSAAGCRSAAIRNGV